jgi:hypothetical protein
MTVDFLARQRPELRFESSDQLIAQMHDDVVIGKSVIAAESAPAWDLIESDPVAALQVRGTDLAALCETAACAVYDLVGLDRTPSVGSGRVIHLNAANDEQLFSEWLAAANEPLDSAGSQYQRASVFQAEDGVLRALLTGGDQPVSRPSLSSLKLSGSIARDRTGWLSARVECGLRS